MATGENQPGLYGALYEAMTDPKLIGNLIRHPEFISQARKICYRIGGPEGAEDLLQETCLRVLERVSQLNPNTIRNEREFFEWVSQLARRIRLSRGWSVAAVSSCTEKEVGWPDDPAGVPHDEMERFQAHADACPYHTRLLHAEDEKLRAIFRRARGLDSQGRILLGADLQTSITEHKRRLQNWREAAFKKCLLFGHVALFNGGKEIASCGKFYDFSIHISRNELEPSPGLQIRGVTSGNSDEDVLLGVYALANVRHEGKEKTLELDNGYTVGLKVIPVSETTFDIYFRCVETKMLEAERAAEDSVDGIVETTDRESLDSSSGGLLPPGLFPPDTPEPPALAGWLPFSQGWRVPAMFAFIVLVAVLCLLLGKKWEQIAARDGLVPAKESQMPLPPVQPPTWIIKELNPQMATTYAQLRDSNLTASRNSRRERTQDAVTDFQVLTGRDHASGIPDGTRYETPLFALAYIPQQRRDSGTRNAVGQKVLDSVGALQLLSTRLSDSNSVIPSAPRASRDQTVITKLSSPNRVDDRRSTPARLMSYEGREDSASKSERSSSAPFQNASYGDRGASSDISVLHSAPNDALLRRIRDALLRQHSRVEPLAEHEQATASFSVTWVTRESSWREASPLVELNAYVYRDGEKNAVYHRSYEVAGISLDAAYDEAVRKTVKEVIDWIRESERRLRPLANEPGIMKQLRADASKEKLNGEDKEPIAGQIPAANNVGDGPKRPQETEDN